MTAINHAVTGAIIGLAVHAPAIAIPAAIVSHLVCDAIPHFGRDKEWIKSTAFSVYLLVEAMLCFGLVIVLYFSGNPNWFLAALCAFAAASPDFISVRRFIAEKTHVSFRPSRLEAFLKNIQWFERPIGAVVEAAWLIAGITILWAIV